MATYFTLLTPAGLAKVANAQLTNEKIEISHVAVGDANGTPYQPLGTETVLKNEVWRGGIASIEIDSQNPNWIVVEGVIPASAGGFTIREVGLFDTDGALIAIGNYPDTYKPVIADGSTMDLALRTIIEVNNVSSVTLKVDPNVIVASRAYVDAKVERSVGVIDTNLTALDERVTTHLAESNLNAHKAKSIVLEDDAGLFTSANVEDGMKELFTNVSNGKQLVGTAITDVDNSLVVPTEPTFQNLADAIGQITTGKKWASGTATSSSIRVSFTLNGGTSTTSQFSLLVSGIDFIPTSIIIYRDDDGVPISFYFDRAEKLIGTVVSGVVIKLQSPAYISSDGFLFPVFDNNREHNWIAFE